MGKSMQRGVTLVEQVVALALAATAAGAVAPAFDAAHQRRHLDGAAQVLRTDLHHARSLAVAQGSPVRLQFNADDSGACYVVHTGARDACTCSSDGSSSCNGSGVVLRSQGVAASTGLRLSSNSASMLFDSGLGTVTPTGTIELVNRRGATLRLIVNIMGRVRQCTTTPHAVDAPAC